MNHVEEIFASYAVDQKTKFIIPQTCFPPLELLYHVLKIRNISSREKFKIEKLQNFTAANISCFTVLQARIHGGLGGTCRPLGPHGLTIVGLTNRPKITAPHQCVYPPRLPLLDPPLYWYLLHSSRPVEFIGTWYIHCYRLFLIQSIDSVVLGGSIVEGSSDVAINQSIKSRILEGCAKLMPSLRVCRILPSVCYALYFFFLSVI